MLEKYSDFLFEKLYHIVDPYKLIFILNTNSIRSYKFQYISTTRNKKMIGYLGDSPISLFKVVLDGKKLTTDYNSREFTYVSRTNVTFDEDEEQIQTDKIEDAFKYIKKIVLIKERVDTLIKSGWFFWW